MANGWGDYIPWAALGGGVLGDVLGAIQRSQAQRQQQALFRLLQDPNKLSAYINAIYRPMSSAEQQATSRELAADRAMRGVASGGTMDQFIADAFAKIESENYNRAAMTALQALTGTRAPTPSGNPLGGTSDALRMIAILSALRNRGSSAGLTLPSGGLPSGSITGVDEIPQVTDTVTV